MLVRRTSCSMILRTNCCKTGTDLKLATHSMLSEMFCRVRSLYEVLEARSRCCCALYHRYYARIQVRVSATLVCFLFLHTHTVYCRYMIPDTGWRVLSFKTFKNTGKLCSPIHYMMFSLDRCMNGSPGQGGR